MGEKKPRYRIHLGPDTAPYLEPDAKGVLGCLEGQLPDMEPGDEIRIVYAEDMTDDEYKALPEWKGP